MRISQQGTQTVVVVNYILPAGNHYTLTYTLSDDGRLHVAADYAPASKADTPSYRAWDSASASLQPWTA